MPKLNAITIRHKLPATAESANGGVPSRNTDAGSDAVDDDEVRRTRRVEVRVTQIARIDETKPTTARAGAESSIA